MGINQNVKFLHFLFQMEVGEIGFVSESCIMTDLNGKLYIDLEEMYGELESEERQILIERTGYGQGEYEVLPEEYCEFASFGNYGEEKKLIPLLVPLDSKDKFVLPTDWQIKMGSPENDLVNVLSNYAVASTPLPNRKFSDEMLEQRLEQAIKNEDFEEAAKIRDQIKAQDYQE